MCTLNQKSRFYCCFNKLPLHFHQPGNFLTKAQTATPTPAVSPAPAKRIPTTMKNVFNLSSRNKPREGFSWRPFILVDGEGDGDGVCSGVQFEAYSAVEELKLQLSRVLLPLFVRDKDLCGPSNSISFKLRRRSIVVACPLSPCVSFLLLALKSSFFYNSRQNAF